MKSALQAKIRAGLSARIILITITVAATTGGFILGYLVGKKTSSDVDVTALKQQAVDSSLQKNETTSEEGTPPQGQATAQTPVTQVPAVSIKDNAPFTPSPQSPSPQEPKASAVGETSTGIAAGPSTSRNAGKEKSLEPASDIKKDSAPTATNLNGESAYFVQAGAFSSRNKADELKRKLNSKGYKITVQKGDSKKHKALYRVIAGEFSKRDDAEILVLKLKKTEGLQASVNKR